MILSSFAVRSEFARWRLELFLITGGSSLIGVIVLLVT